MSETLFTSDNSNPVSNMKVRKTKQKRLKTFIMPLRICSIILNWRATVSPDFILDFLLTFRIIYSLNGQKLQKLY